MEEYLTITEVAVRPKIKPKTIKNKMAAGIFKRGGHYFSPQVTTADHLNRGPSPWETDFVFKNREGKPIKEDKWRGKYWYRALRVRSIRPRKFYATRHTFISVGVSNGANPEWLAEYCGTSVAMIEKHYGRCIHSDSQEQLRRVFGAKTETLCDHNHTDDVDSKTIESVEIADDFEREKRSGRVNLSPASKKRDDK